MLKLSKVFHAPKNDSQKEKDWERYMMMTTRCRILTMVAVLVIAVLCTTSTLVYAQEVSTERSFAEGTIEVPQETEIYIDDTNNIVTITDNPTDIANGNAFVVYLKELPIGYVAQSVTVQGSRTIISVEKADKSVDALLDEEGVIELTPDM